MGLKATCPNNSKHKRFTTVAHVMQEWEVDDEGNFVKCLDQCMQVEHGPDKDNMWGCVTCGAIAKVEYT